MKKIKTIYYIRSFLTPLEFYICKEYLTIDNLKKETNKQKIVKREKKERNEIDHQDANCNVLAYSLNA